MIMDFKHYNVQHIGMRLRLYKEVLLILFQVFELFPVRNRINDVTVKDTVIYYRCYQKTLIDVMGIKGTAYTKTSFTSLDNKALANVKMFYNSTS